MESVPSAMVAMAGGGGEFYRLQVEDLEFQLNDDVEQMYKSISFSNCSLNTFSEILGSLSIAF